MLPPIASCDVDGIPGDAYLNRRLRYSYYCASLDLLITVDPITRYPQ